MKDDAIAQLSDQLVALSARLQELEKTHNTALMNVPSYHSSLYLGCFCTMSNGILDVAADFSRRTSYTFYP